AQGGKRFSPDCSPQGSGSPSPPVRPVSPRRRRANLAAFPPRVVQPLSRAEGGGIFSKGGRGALRSRGHPRSRPRLFFPAHRGCQSAMGATARKGARRLCWIEGGARGG